MVGALSVGAQWLAWQLQMPAIVLMLRDWRAVIFVGEDAPRRGGDMRIAALAPPRDTGGDTQPPAS